MTDELKIPYKAIHQMLSETMNTAAENGANSISMPDFLVEVAYWLCHTDENAPSTSELQRIIKEQQKQIEKLQKRVSDAGWENERLAREYNESERYSWK